MRDRTDRRPFRDGALAGAVALALLWAIASIDPGIVFAPLGLGDRLIRATPGDVSAFLIEHLQHDAQRLAAAGSTLALLLAGGAFARASSPRWAAVGFAGLIAAANLAEPTGVRARALLVTTSAAAVAYALTLRALRPRPSCGDPDAPSSAENAFSRRRALVGAGAALLGFLGLGTLLRGAAAPGGAPPLALPRGSGAPPRAAFPKIDGLSAAITPVGGHYVVDIDLSDPLLDARSWMLRVDGLAGTPLNVGFDELQRRFAVVEEPTVLTCISNEVGGPLVGCSSWLGVRLRDLVRAAGPLSTASGLAFHCADGYSVGVPMWAALHPSSLVAIGQNGEALTREHGFPCRVRVPAMYGMMNAKWVERISIVDHRFLGYWQRQGWEPDAEVRTQSRIDAITPRRARETGWIAGVAWAGVRGIARVEVSVDGGRSWQPAALEDGRSPWAWRRWALRWTPAAGGRHSVMCRAVDGTGGRQVAARSAPRPGGATGYHRRDVVIV